MLASLLLAAATPSPVRFAPATDHPYRYTTSETRKDGTNTYRFTVERRVTFRRDGNGWTATISVENYHVEAPAPMARVSRPGRQPSPAATFCTGLTRPGR